MGDDATIGGRYALDGRLGEGGMGQVYKARHLQLGKAFALKIISPAFALDSAARARFNEEAKLASEISHPNIVSVVDFGEDAQFGAYMVMELVEGEPLFNEGAAPMSVKRAIDVLGQIADALDHIHRRGIVHGDVKADNIMLTGENDSSAHGGARRRRVARLLDFGLARRPGGEDEDEVSGSPHYLAPERAAGGPPSVAADVYALGVLGYLMLTGSLPFDGNVVEILMAHINQPPQPPSARRGEDIDEALEALVLRAMAKDPAHRHGSAAAFRYELNTVMDMLEMGRRRRASGTVQPESPREATLVAAFERNGSGYAEHHFGTGREGSGIDSELGVLDYGAKYRIFGAIAADTPAYKGKKRPNMLEVYAAGRTLWLDNSVTLTAPFSRREATLSSSHAFTSPILGGRFMVDFTPEIFMLVDANGGGFGVDSVDFTGSVAGLVGYRFMDLDIPLSIQAGYKALRYDVDKGGPTQTSATLNGPFLGLTGYW